MTDPMLDLMRSNQRSDWVRLRTIIRLRWVAIAGQIAVLVVAYQIYGLELELGLCFLAIGLSVIGNMIGLSVYPETKRLSEQGTFGVVLFDLLQLSFLLYLTGGLHNPFGILLLGPVTISAVVLTLRSTLILAGTAIVMATVLSAFHIPLQFQDGSALTQPGLIAFGTWGALVVGILFLAAYARSVSSEISAMSEALAATQMALAREQQLTDLGGVVAAAAHELGTPLATIKLASSELIEELKDRPDLREDAELIRAQANRCRDILRHMDRPGTDNPHRQDAPASAILAEAAEPHINRGKTVHVELQPISDQDLAEPIIRREAQVIHGLRNLIQNAVDFAETEVWAELRWSPETISVRIIDDGPGFPNQVIGRIGDPFVRQRRAVPGGEDRPEYEGMGLGLFIAKTLLERSGAELRFANTSGKSRTQGTAHSDSGAIVQVNWPRAKLAPFDAPWP